MKELKILFVRGDSLISKLINKFDGEYSHIAIDLGNNLVLEAQRFTNSRIKTNYFKDYDEVSIEITDDQFKMINDIAVELVEKKYDYKFIITLFLNRLFGFKLINPGDAYICSELVVKFLEKIGYFNKNESTSLANSTPNQLYNYITFIKKELKREE